MLPADAEVVIDEIVAHPLPYFSLVVTAPPHWSDLVPGQFAMVRVAPGHEPFLRRAFSVHDVSRGAEGLRLELLVKVVGPGTAALAARRPGERLAVLGPLGRGFTLPEEQEGPVALVAGGVGSAPLLLLARGLRERGLAFDFYYGGRSAVDLPRWERFARLTESSGGRFVAVTEDGSLGTRGLVTAPLEAALASGRCRRLYACGPMPMLARVAALAAAAGIPGEVSVETPMGCGFGACLGCAVPTPSGRYALCCQDGPVFACSEVRW